MLRVSSENFDVDAYVAICPFEVVRVFRRGEPRRLRTDPDAKRERSGFNAVVSKCDLDDFKGQVREAIDFLKQHADEVRRLVALVGETSVSIDFGVADREDVVVQSETIPAELVRLAAACNLALKFSRYPEMPNNEKG